MGEVYYKRLLSSYNFVIVDLTRHHFDKPSAHCYLWDEMNGNRGSNEIASCLFDFCNRAAEAGVQFIDFFSDNCGGQNRNRLVAAMLHHVVQATQLEEITVNYLVKGHTENQADTIHSMVEAKKASAKLFLPSEWATVIRSADADNKFAIEVYEMSYGDFYDAQELFTRYKNFKIDEEGEKAVNWLNLAAIRFKKGSVKLYHKKSHGDLVYSSLNMMQVGKGRRVAAKIYEMQPLLKAYLSTLPISAAKFKDLQELCRGDKPVIPSRYHEFYQDLKFE